MKESSSQKLVYSIVLGYIIILNIIGSSYLDFYPTWFLIGTAFGTGMVMVISSLYFFLVEPHSMTLTEITPVDDPVAVIRSSAMPA